MAIYGNTHWLEVWGDLAGFFPPDAKVEGYSYPIITPSAARNIFRAIYMNPYQFEWVAQHIALLSEPQYIGIKTNEFATEKTRAELIPWSRVLDLIRGKPVDLSNSVVDHKNIRSQRNRYMLYKPRFLIAAQMRFWDEDVDIIKHEEMFLRRARNGQYARRPYLGLRELVASFRYIEIGQVDEAIAEVIAFWRDSSRLRPPQDLGYMSYDPWDITARPIVLPNGRVSRHNPKADSSPNRFKKFHAMIEVGWLTSSDRVGTDIPPTLPQPEDLYE